VVPPADKPRGLLLPLVLSTFVGAGLVVSALLYFRDPKPEVAAVIDAGPQTAAVAVPKVPVVAVPDATEEPDDDEDEDEPDAMATPDAAVTPDAMPDWVAWLEVHEKKAKAFSAEGKCDAITPLVRAARERSTEAAARLDAIRKRCKPAKEVPPPRRPKPAPVPSPDPPGGPRDRAAILMGLKPLLGRIQACGQSTGQTGRVPVRILIAPGGDVQHVSITDPSVAGTPLAACVAQVVKTARFQKAETTSNVVFPFMVR
jgi:hypothetical protein